MLHPFPGLESRVSSAEVTYQAASGKRENPKSERSEPPAIESRAITAAQILIKISSLAGNEISSQLEVVWSELNLRYTEQPKPLAAPSLACCITATLAGPPNLQKK